jgi:Intracellular proteinase inhibitor
LTPLVLLALAAALGRQPDSMRVEIVVPPKVAAGVPVPIAIRIGNTADRPIELHLQGRTVVFDLIVSRGDAVVWRRLEGESVTAILQLRMLAPGEVLELKDTWQQKDGRGRTVGPGEYTVTGVVPTDAAPLRAGPVTLMIDG